MTTLDTLTYRARIGTAHLYRIAREHGEALPDEQRCTRHPVLVPTLLNTPTSVIAPTVDWHLAGGNPVFVPVAYIDSDNELQLRVFAITGYNKLHHTVDPRLLSSPLTIGQLMDVIDTKAIYQPRVEYLDKRETHTIRTILEQLKEES